MIHNRELDRAETEANQAGAELERAFGHVKDALFHELKPEVENYVRRRVANVSSGVTGVLDEYASMAEDRGRRMLGSVREAAERELRMMDERPLTTWSIVLMSGLLLGYWLGKNQQKLGTAEIHEPLAVPPEIPTGRVA
jgi:hypothetical protein